MSVIDGKTKRFSANSIFPTFFYATFGLVLDYDRFLAKMRKAKRVRITLDVYQNGRPVFDFDVSGFDFKKFQAKS